MNKAIKLFLDVEFNGTGGSLISAALVPAEGERWYEVLDTTGVELVSWVQENVMPVTHKPAVTMDVFEASLSTYLKQFGYIEFIYNAHADKRYLDDMLDGLPGVPLYRCTRDGKLSAAHSIVPHNALYDAEAMVASVAGSDVPNEFGLQERTLFLKLWELGYPIDRRDVRLDWKSADDYKFPDSAPPRTFTGCVVTVTPRPGHKTLDGATTFIIPHKLQNASYSGTMGNQRSAHNFLYLYRNDPIVSPPYPIA